jgi:hypothetical protein
MELQGQHQVDTLLVEVVGQLDLEQDLGLADRVVVEQELLLLLQEPQIPEVVVVDLIILEAIVLREMVVLESL